MSFTTSKTVVGTTAISILTVGANDKEVWIFPAYGQLVYIGDATLTVDTGYPIIKEFHSDTITSTDVIYAISGGDKPVTVYVLLRST